MCCNVGYMDGIIRIALGVFIMVLGWYYYQSYWAFVGLIPVVSGLFRFCPFYRMFKTQSCEDSQTCCC